MCIFMCLCDAKSKYKRLSAAIFPHQCLYAPAYMCYVMLCYAVLCVHMISYAYSCNQLLPGNCCRLLGCE